MKPYYQDNHIRIFNKDCRSMDELPDESVQCVVTSPPYFGLRKYSGEQELIWGGEPDCEHQWGSLIPHPMHKSGGHTAVSDISKSTQDTQDEVRHKGNLGCWCQICSAWRGALGLEPSMELYIQHLLEIMREIKRVLRKDGVCFLNLGDSYATHASGSKKTGHNFRSAEVAAEQGIGTINRLYGKNIGLKEKDLCLIPFRVAIAAQEDGWWVRSVIIWSKPNPMPESVTDRPTESHEYILMLTKSGTSQYWTHPRKRGSRTAPKPDYIWTHKRTGLVVDYQPVSDRVFIREGKKVKLWSVFWARRNLWQGHDYYWDADAVRESSTEKPSGNIARKENIQPRESHFATSIPYQPNGGGRNIRTVWEFPTQPYPEAHFAVFPEKLPELCIKAATPEVGCCSKCGAPWERIIERTKYEPEIVPIGVRQVDDSRGDKTRKLSGKEYNEQVHIQTLGWQPTCKCNAARVPSLVLDPFAGAGTTLWVAKKLNRYAVGYELSQEYCQLALERCQQQVMGL